MKYAPPPRAVHDTTAEHHDYGLPPKTCDRCGIDFGTTGDLCIDCIDVLNADAPATPPETVKTPTLVVLADGTRRVTTGNFHANTPADAARNNRDVTRLRQRGLNDVQIALELGLSNTTVYRIRKRLGLPPVKPTHSSATAHRRAS